MARHEMADQVAILLQQAYPNELTKEELKEQAALPDKELRKALDSLSEEGELDMLAEEYRWRDPSGEGHPPPDPEPTPSPSEDAPLRTDLIKPGTHTNRIIMEVVAGIEPVDGEDDEQIMARAEQAAVQIQNVLGMALPSYGAVVVIRRLEAYDKPRVLYDAVSPQIDEPQS